MTTKTYITLKSGKLYQSKITRKKTQENKPRGRPKIKRNLIVQEFINMKPSDLDTILSMVIDYKKVNNITLFDEMNKIEYVNQNLSQEKKSENLVD